MVQVSGRIGAAVVGGLITFVALVGCSPTPAPEQAPSSETESTPESSPVASETPAAPERYEGSDFELSKPLPAELEYLQTASFDEFAAAPKSDQLAWKSWAEQYKPQLVEYINSVFPKDVNAPYTLTADSDVFTVLKDLQATDRLIANLGGGTPASMDDNGRLEVQLGTKIIIAQTKASDVKFAETVYKSTFSDPLGGVAANAVQTARLDYFDLVQEAQNAADFKSNPMHMQFDDQDINSYHVQFTDSEGETYYAVVGSIEFTDFEGNRAFTTVYNGFY